MAQREHNGILWFAYGIQAASMSAVSVCAFVFIYFFPKTKSFEVNLYSKYSQGFTLKWIDACATVESHAGSIL